MRAQIINRNRNGNGLITMGKKFGITGDDLKALRKRSGFTQSVVATRVGVQRQTLSNWENGVGEPPSQATFKLLGLFGIKTLLPLFEEVESVVKEEEVKSKTKEDEKTTKKSDKNTKAKK